MSIRSKLKEQVRFVKTIRGNKLESVKQYTAEAYSSINSGLLDKTKLSRKYQNIVDDLDDLFAKVPPTTQELIVFRGIKKRHEFGNLAGFVSTTYDYDTALSFADDKNQCCILIITVPIGARVLPVEDISVNPTEGEILLPRSGYFVATETTYRNGMECFYLNLVVSTTPTILPETASPSLPKFTDEQLVKMIVNNISLEEIELLGIEDAITSVIDSIEQNIGIKISENVVFDALIELRK